MGKRKGESKKPARRKAELAPATDAALIRVASYLTELPAKAVLAKKLKAVASFARTHLSVGDGKTNPPVNTY